MDTPEALKLRYGKRSVKVRLRRDGEVVEKVLSLEEAGAGDQLRTAVGSPGLMTIHTEEATLEAIFIHMTGRGLEG